MTMYGTAQRATEKQAARHFANGGRVAVSVDGESHFPVGAMTTTHHRDRGTWEELTAVVESYGDSRQRFYVVIEHEPRQDSVTTDDEPEPHRIEATVKVSLYLDDDGHWQVIDDDGYALDGDVYCEADGDCTDCGPRRAAAPDLPTSTQLSALL